jgi:hypothetical protein
MLWTLLALSSSATFLASAVLSARHARTGFSGYVLALVVGLLLALINFWIMSSIATAFSARLKGRGTSQMEWSARALYLAVALWIPVAGFVGDFAASSVMGLRF